MPMQLTSHMHNLRVPRDFTVEILIRPFQRVNSIALLINLATRVKKMRAPTLLRPTARCLVRSHLQGTLRPSWTRSLNTETPQTSATQPSKDVDTKRKPQALSESDPVGHFFGKTKENEPRYPRGVQALYLQPLRREAEYGIPSCDLQLRSYSLRNLEFFSDFALRAAYYLKLPAFGPVPLPRITERWTVPRSSFIFKKSQENFERVTMRRLVQIRDGNPETVQLWLAFLQKHAYYGIGMKANVWDFGKLGVGKAMDAIDPEATEAIDSQWKHIGQNRELDTVEKVEEFLATVRFDKDSGKRSEGERRFLQTQWKKDEAAKRKAAASA
ncbi:ribosomal protein S10 domain-containing protein [Colletotrichum godetiae]|uniref:Small ribosomal subunit protein uS10m n=1 Tax=Colletotrichum godetiae TaxID=1209918 RepID=A0AAJ0A746_9PEZI|nr:ribosomal protein S10 domain-containing protein [Colletotrichum godetiae]KAK1657098.1 ribosomal protein S10 domain-containing protein [Colletotrichum godetiae]